VVLSFATKPSVADKPPAYTTAGLEELTPRAVTGDGRPAAGDHVAAPFVDTNTPALPAA
jgi:hypothetical protein